MKPRYCIVLAQILLSVAQGLSADAMAELRERIGSAPIPRFETRDTSAKDVLALLAKLHADSTKRPLQFRFLDNPTRLPGFTPLEIPTAKPLDEPVAERPFSVSLTNIPLCEAFVFFARSIGCSMTFRGDEVLIFPDVGTVEPLVTRTYKGGPPPGVESIPTAPEGRPKMDVREQLAQKGVRFFRGGVADYFPEEKRLVIRTSESELRNFEILLPIE